MSDWSRRLRRRLRALRQGAALDAELDEEMRVHVELEAEELVRSGLTPEEARRRALVAFGGIERYREAHRDARGTRWLEDLARDLRRAWRGLLHARAFSGAAVLTLGLGVGITTAMFSVADGILLRPLAFPGEDRLVTMCESFPGATAGWCGISPPNVEDIAVRTRTIAAIGFGRSDAVRLRTAASSELLDAGIATPGMFAALGVKPERGRALLPGDVTGHEGSVAVITDELWRGRFGAAADIPGRVIDLDGRPVTIVGVMPPGFVVPQYDWIQLWRPVPFDPRDEQNRDWRGFASYARLRPGVGMAAARADLARVAATLRSEHFATTAGWGVSLRPLRDLVVGGTRPLLLVFMSAVLLVLLAACFNLANLLLARAASRTRELSLSAALGATRGRLVRWLLGEALVLSLGGAILALALGWGGVHAFKLLAPPGVPRLDEVRVDARVWLFALAVTVGCALLFGLVPALRATRLDIADALRDGARTATGRKGRLRPVLVVAELALAATLLAGAGLLVRNFRTMSDWRPGFEQEHLTTFQLFASHDRYADEAAIVGLWQRVEQALATVPGVVSVGEASAGPVFGGGDGASELRAEGARASLTPVTGEWFDVSPTYFRTMGIPLVRGRGITPQDVAGAPPVAVVNQALARRLWPAGLPPVARITLPELKRTVDVVGVVRDVPPLRPDAAPQPQIFWSDRQFPRGARYFVVRSAVPPERIARLLRTRVAAVDPELTPSSITTVAQLVSNKLVRPRFNMLLLVVFAATALALAAVGTYGLLAYLVSRRTREFGVRLALGCLPRGILTGVVREGLALALAGMAIGAAGALVLGRALAHAVEGTQPFDATSFLASFAILAGVVLVACALPARRASRVDPVAALRAE